MCVVDSLSKADSVVTGPSGPAREALGRVLLPGSDPELTVRRC